ncbi:HNH endonuclease [Frankia sp. AgB1.9]|uniref:DUF5710 domain-containing protein n=1 Tax=unclassified Frankia TaxID=2632575 RepID=UPI001932218E|nr:MULTISPECIES: DUF5710 domain-containing protein [unclassified Frankia]MBL7487421.1 HNH endonuclease [Frankia sp. AgW1.1]MBL7551061.1 HNH endonuclease [Frankia sp. AgB1.9]MBL7618842.1 HNH endonuclease [Frankia sp. AgB1.8]
MDWSGGRRCWLEVPFAEKDLAKAAGARWDPAAGRWYAPRPDMPGLDRWAVRSDLPALLPGEDRSFGSGLFVDLVPSSCWFTNARSCLEPGDWARLRRMVLARANQRCEACGRGRDQETLRWLEVHERWAYDELTHVQRLRRLVCLCSSCHTATHFGRAVAHGGDLDALAHLRQVTGMTDSEAVDHVGVAFALWEMRSQAVWTLDLSILTGAGLALRPPPVPADRARAARL